MGATRGRWLALAVVVGAAPLLWGCDDETAGATTTGTTTSGTGGAGGGGSSATGGFGGQGGNGGLGGSAGSGGDTVPLDGFGAIGGDCGLIDGIMLTSADPSSLESSLDFGTDTFDYAALSTGGQEVYDDGNLGGSSLYSEVFAYEVLYRCDLAELLKTEGEIGYQDPNGKKTDLLVEIEDHRVGVSVIRAVSYPPNDPYPVTQAETLLSDKLSDVLLSTANVAPADAWTKQVLFIMAYGDDHAAALAQAYGGLDGATKADTIVLVTVTHGDDDFIYF